MESTASLAEVTRLITDGKHGDCVDEFDSGYFFISCKDVRDGKIQYDDARQITRADFEDTHRRTRLEPNDILITNSGTIGRMALVQESELTQRTTFQKSVAIVKPNQKRIEPKFLYYTLLAQVGYLVELSGGTAQKNLLLGDLRRFKLRVPHLEAQKKIAAILSAYDDLIENNRRRIALLEKMAEEIYREWFVRMRFPGHEQTKFEKGVPSKWGIVELQAIASEVSKSAKPGNHLSDRYYLPLDLLSTRQMLPADHQDYTEAQSSLVTFEEGDILFGAMRPYLHKVAIAPFKGITRTTCFVIRPKDDKAYSYLYLTLFQQSSIDYADMICNGADRPYVVWNRGMERMKVFEPDTATLEMFENVVGPILKAIKSKYFLLRNLKQARDNLLGRLISGKLPVETLDIQFPPNMLDQPSPRPPSEGRGSEAEAHA